MNTKKILIAILAVSLVAGGCTKSLEGLNNNPNQPTAVTPNVVLSAALVQTGYNMANDFQNLPCWIGYWSRSGNYVPDVQTETYNIAHNYTDSEWTRMYGNLSNYNYIENAGRSVKNPFYIGAAKVMQAFVFSTLVDVYNNVPYSDAFKVATEVQPKYDDAQTIYNALVVNLDSAFGYFEAAKTFYTTVATQVQINTDNQYDIIFGGGRPAGSSVDTSRMSLWEQFANTVKLKLLIHQSQVSSQQPFIKSEIAKTAAFGYLGAGQSASVNPGYQASSGKINPLFGDFYTVTGSTTVTQNYYRGNSVAVNFYLNTADNRGFYVYTGVGNTIAGNYEGDPNSLPNSSTSGVGPGLLKGYTQDELILSDFESLFLQAEAVQRGYITSGNAQSLYQQAITQNYIYLYSGVSGAGDPVAESTAYYTSGQTDVDWTASPNPLEAILTQKWIAFNGINWVEAWTDYRRTGIPALPITASPTHLVPQIPIRYLYPQIELNTNGGNVPQIGSNAQFTSKIFWNQ